VSEIEVSKGQPRYVNIVWDALQDKVSLTPKEVREICVRHRPHQEFVLTHQSIQRALTALVKRGSATRTKIKKVWLYSDKKALEQDTIQAKFFKIQIANQARLDNVCKALEKMLSRHGITETVKTHGDEIHVKLTVELAEEWLGLLRRKM